MRVCVSLGVKTHQMLIFFFIIIIIYQLSGLLLECPPLEW